jgi:hypothetical protein
MIRLDQSHFKRSENEELSSAENLNQNPHQLISPIHPLLVDYRAILLMLLGAYFTTSIVFAVASGYAIRIAKASAQTLIHLIPAVFTAGAK